MKRISKRYDERLSEILDVAETLFFTKGYEKTTVNDILEGVGIGKGTFYHYFESKEQVMDAVIMRMIGAMKAAAQGLAETPGVSASEKLFRILTMPSGKNKDVIDELHHNDNSAIHQKSLIESVLALSPILTQVVKQGIDEGMYHTPYPQESVEFLLTAAQFLLDPGLFKWTAQDIQRKLKAFTWILETVLGTEKGSFDYFLTIYEGVLSGKN